jgi:hypothetical protein
MKKFIGSFAIASALAVSAFGASANTVIRAKVPFEFVVGTATLPAGEYEFKEGINHESMLVVGRSTNASAFVMTNNAGSLRTGDPSLTFRNVNGKNYLQGVTSATMKREIKNSATRNTESQVATVKATQVIR